MFLSHPTGPRNCTHGAKHGNGRARVLPTLAVRYQARVEWGMKDGRNMEFMTLTLSAIGAITGTIAIMISLAVYWKVSQLPQPAKTTRHGMYFNSKLGIYVDRKDEAAADIQPVKLDD